MHRVKKRWETLKSDLSGVPKSAFLWNSLVYSGSNIPTQAASFLSGLALRRLFPPAVMGYWNLRGVAQSALSTFDLGAEIGAARELPLLAGQGKAAEAALCRSTALTFACLQSLLITGAWFLYVGLNASRHTPLETFALVLSGLLFMLTDIQSVYVAFFRSAQAYRPLSRIMLVSGVGEAVLIPAAAWWGGLHAAFGAALLAAAARLAYYSSAARKAGAGASLGLDRPILVRLVKFGVRFRVVDYPYSTAMLLPLLWVTKLMGLEDLALYSLAAGLVGQVGEVSNRIGTVFTTRFIERAGSGASRAAQAEETRRFLNLQMLVLLPLICWAAGIAIPLTVHLLIPKYGAAVDASLILLASTFFLSNSVGLGSSWLASGRLLPMGLANAGGLACMALALFFSNRTIEGVAWAAVAGNAGHFACVLFTVGRENWPPSVTLGLYLRVAIAAGWTFAVLRFMSSAPPFIGPALGFATLLPLVAYGIWGSRAARPY